MAWGSIGGFTSSKKGIFGTTTTYTHPSLATNEDATYQVRLKGTTTEVTLTKTQKLTSAISTKDNTNVNLYTTRTEASIMTQYVRISSIQL